LTTNKSKAVFFDRDGVLNEAEVRDGKPYPPPNVESMVIPIGLSYLLNSLKNVGFLLICVTNQPDIARGKTTIENVLTMNNKLKNLLQLDDIYMCIHDNQDECSCRKPKPGMIFDAADKWNIDLKRSWMIGDRFSDIEAGKSAFCNTIFLDKGYSEKQPYPPADKTFKNIEDAIFYILSKEI
jgi:D-glycero-D-manno-heptose 1,7-bisphosphate phosphatase